MGRGVRGWLALDAVSQGDVLAEESVDHDLWIMTVSMAYHPLDGRPWTR